ncbi:MAG: carbohydrate ABC transporter permease [Thermofilaceae archaeon]
MVGEKVAKLFLMVLLYAALVLLSLVYMMPFIRSAVASFMVWAQASRYPPEWIPNPFTLDNYIKLFSLSLFPRWILNTALFSGLVTAFNLVTSSMAGYAFALLRFPRKDALFSALLALLMVPPFVTIIPNFILVSRLGLVDNLFALAWLSSAGISSIYLMRQYYMSLGRELFEAARIDGADPLRVYFYVALPLAKPALGAVAVYQFLGSWNSFLGPLVFLRSVENFTLPVGLNFAFARSMWVEYTPIIAGSLLASLPTIVLYVVLNKYLIRGIVVTAKKG